MKVLVSGLINIETNVAVENFPIQYCPIEYAFNKVSLDISGVAYNIINALYTLGDEVEPVTIIGKDKFGNFIKENIQKLCSSTQNVFQELDSTCTSVVMFDNQGKRKIYCDLKDIQDRNIPLSRLEKPISACDGIVVCNINFNDELIRNAKKFNKPVFTDLHVLKDINDPYNKRFLENADIVFLSDEGLPCKPEEFVEELYSTYKSKVIVLGQGEKGALLFDGQTQKFHFEKSVHTRPVVNTVGAGDALFSCFVHYYLKGLSPSECLKRAVFFASYKIGESGGAKGFITEQKLEEIMRKS
ncbi:MAG: carbohydrate kinase family protein [Treponema sp.]|nr:carbohydrate kinase family protein [Treponema sp.]